MDAGCSLIRNEVVETSFSFYSGDEIRRLSVKQITSPVAFDSLNHPVPGGLYDPALGPVEPHNICVTCHQSQRDCPGHMGHIELAHVAYHPMLFPKLFRLLRQKCFNCHRFRMSETQIRRYRVKMMLLDCGELVTALNLDAELDGSEEVTANIGDKEDQISEARTARRQEILDRYERFCQARKLDFLPGHIRLQRDEVVQEFYKSIPTAKCNNCGAISPSLRKDGHSKIFQKPLSDKAKRAMAALNIKLTDAVTLDVASNGQEDSAAEDSDDEFEITDSAGAQPRYLPPLEVQSQTRLLWESEGATLQHLFHVDGDPSKGWEMFFMNVIPVPPARFRPPTTLGELTFEHPQNVYLTKILQLNERLLQADEYSQRRRAEALEKSENGAAVSDQKDSAFVNLSQMLSTWIDLQNAINCFMDSAKDSSNGRDMPSGIRQLLEKKEGLFRKHMMGKRVNYAARSVISPDPYLSTSEIGVPLRFAKKLTYPQPVTPWNVVALREAVINGPDIHPGANFVEDERGRLVDLSKRTEQQRVALAKTLLTRSQSEVAGVKKVWRHLHTGDVLLVNRQPTLHKPSIMAHRARVLRNPKQQTIRMHYANCNTFNADFDGDEINLHFPQNELARAEAYLIASNDHQYVVPTNGKPIRGLIQDHVGTGVKLTKRDTFLTRDEYMQVVFAACSGLEGLEIPEKDIITLPPVILKPKPMWTGKQVISTLVLNFTAGLPPLNLDSKSKVPGAAFGTTNQEHIVIFRGGELLQGVLDKGQFGATEFGFIHACYELYGPRMAADLLTALGRLFTIYLQYAGHTCGIEDLTLTADAEQERAGLIAAAEVAGEHGAASWAFQSSDATSTGEESQPLDDQERAAVKRSLRERLLRDPGQNAAKSLDAHMMGVVSASASAIIRACLPNGQEKPFPDNCFSLMVNSGAKGSMVNHSQISCGLGQQALEGRRTPVMVSGKSLPSFQPYELSPRAGGFVTDRFLTGIRPQEYYFHCMAGREGLVDTAVKTSRSGYLQRCLGKHLEDLRVHYDYTVRNAEGCVVQFLYGDDGIDVLECKYLNGKDDQLNFIARNTGALGHKYSLHGEFFAKTGFDMTAALKAHRLIEKSVLNLEHCRKKSDKIPMGTFVQARRKRRVGGKWKAGGIIKGWHDAEIIAVNEEANRYDIRYLADGHEERDVPRAVSAKGNRRPSGLQTMPGKIVILLPAVPDPVLHQTTFSKHVGALSERLQEQIRSYIERNPEQLIRNIGGNDNSASKSSKKDKKKKRSSQSGDESSSSSAHGAVAPMAFELLMWVKYMQSLAQPGESVGVIAAQSVGEPSTQMTLNTFHLAGHGGANVTLGIPRLREIIMTASKSISTPAMTIPLLPSTSRQEAEVIARQLYRLRLSELLQSKMGIIVKEALKPQREGAPLWVREYVVRLNLQPLGLVQSVHDIDENDVGRALGFSLIPKLLSLINRELKRSGDVATGIVASAVEADEALQVSKAPRKRKDAEEGEDEDEDEQGTLRFGRKNEVSGYGEMDDVERSIHSKSVKELADSDSEDETLEKRGNKNRKGRSTPDVDHIDEEDTASNSPQKAFHGKGTSVLEVGQVAHKSKFFHGCYYNAQESWAEIKLQFPTTFKKLLMVDLVETIAEDVLVRHSPGIKQCFVVEQKLEGRDTVCIQTNGVNFEKMWELDHQLDINRLETNDIYQILVTYGVEAARASISKQINDVFGVYGIAVDHRHLGLIADYMTFSGGYTPLNRSGMTGNSSPFLQMSFETTMNFLTTATAEGMRDHLTSPSAKIVLGQPIPAGTGSFELLQPLT